jgi:ketosteroid isomerase-like protein
MTLVNFPSLFVCGVLILFASVVYGAGSYQRTRDGRTLVWRDVPARGDEATWSGKRDKDGYATGSGVLTWYKVQPAIVTGSNILDTRRYVNMINHYSGTMVRGKFKGGVTYVEAEGRRLQATSRNETNRPSRRQKAARLATAQVRATPTAEPTTTPFSQPITVDTPELTSARATPTPPPQESSSRSAEESETAVPPATPAVVAQETAIPPDSAREESSSPNAEESETIVPPETPAVVAKDIATPPESVPEESSSPTAEESETMVPLETTAALAGKPIASPPEGAAEQSSSPSGQEPQTAVPQQTDTLVAKQMASPASEHEARLSHARSLTVPTPTRSDDPMRSLNAQPSELPKPPGSIDAETVAGLDTLFQSAVKANDVAIMDQILADDFVLVTDRGASSTKADLIEEAKEKRTMYEHQEVEKGTQKVRIWRDTAVVTALLRIKGSRDQNPFDYKVWVSETFVRTPTGWRYVFGQASKPEAK